MPLRECGFISIFAVSFISIDSIASCFIQNNDFKKQQHTPGGCFMFFGSNTNQHARCTHEFVIAPKYTNIFPCIATIRADFVASVTRSRDRFFATLSTCFWKYCCDLCSASVNCSSVSAVSLLFHARTMVVTSSGFQVAHSCASSSNISFALDCSHIKHISDLRSSTLM